MTVDARPTHHSHPSQEPGRTEGTSKLFADDAELPSNIEDIDDEMPDDLALHAESTDLREEGDEDTMQEIASYDLAPGSYDRDDVDPEHHESEVEDTPGDDATIAAARIERFDEAHRGIAPVDAGPFEERSTGVSDDDAKR